jgi:hypothetical protein
MKIKNSVVRNLLNFCLKEEKLQEIKIFFEKSVGEVPADLTFAQEHKELEFYRPLTSVCYHKGRLLGCDGYRWIAVDLEDMEEGFQENNAYISIEYQGLLNAWMKAAEQSKESIDVHSLINESGILLPKDNIFSSVDATRILQEVLVEDVDQLLYVNARGLLQLLELIVSIDLDDSATIGFLVIGSGDLGIMFRANNIQGCLMALKGSSK